MKKFYVGVKGVIKEDRGYLILKSTKGHWDIPGGRMDSDETFEQTIIREVSEELPGSEVTAINELQGAFRLHKDIDDDISLVLLYFLVKAKLPKEVKLSYEHESFIWVNRIEDLPDDLNPEIDRILRKLLA